MTITLNLLDSAGIAGALDRRISARRFGRHNGASDPPDGYTLLMIGLPNAINATLYDKLNFNFVRDIAPVAAIMRVPLVMLVNPSFPARTVPEFIAYAKANPGKLNTKSLKESRTWASSFPVLCPLSSH
jgi:hypothetical protein